MGLLQRKMQRKDIATLKDWFATEREGLLWAGAAMPWPLQRATFIGLIKAHTGTHPPRELWCLDDAEGKLVGHYQLRCNYRLRTLGLGRVAIAPDRRGQGLGQALMDLAIDYAFSRAWVHRLELNVYNVNRRAFRTYRKAGFVLEGTRRQTTPIGHELWDTHMMSLLRPDYARKLDKRTEGE